MRIAVNARHMMRDRLEGIGTVTDEIMKRITKDHPDDAFDYYFDRAPDRDFLHYANVTGYSFFPPARLPVLIRYWMDNPVRRHVMKQHADVFFSPDGFLPMNLRIPKVTMVHDIGFLRNPLHVTPMIRKFYAERMPVFVKEADHIITVSHFSKAEMMEVYNLSSDKVSVVYNGVSPLFSPLPPDKIQEVRDQYFDGFAYFLYLGSIHPRKNIHTLIRAFEKFKEDTGSEFHLVIAGRPSWYTKEIFDHVRKSKWENEIHATGFVAADAAKKMIASAHALIYPSRYEGFGLPVIEAMASHTPVICSNVASLPEIAGGAALYFDPGDMEELVGRMKEITTDQALRQKLISAGKERIKLFSWDTAAGATYEILRGVAGK